ncbi:MAG: type II toxin-antitoxin system VapC family toxin [Bacteroidota bacterium]|nr:type II toxin-antitoxin system VapC family toxin [Bacteroidota bacterium]
MNILADTHIFIWILQNNPKLSETRKNLVTDTSNEIWVSPFSFMEIVIKLKIGKLPEVFVDAEFLANQWLKDGYNILPVTKEHIYYYQQLPFIENHRDPFDRFIISTAIKENMSIMTDDEKFKAYSHLVNLV